MSAAKPTVTIPVEELQELHDLLGAAYKALGKRVSGVERVPKSRAKKATSVAVQHSLDKRARRFFGEQHA